MIDSTHQDLPGLSECIGALVILAVALAIYIRILIRI
jgi:hypothetical protein